MDYAYKPINPNQLTSTDLKVRKTHELQLSSEGITATQFRSGSATESESGSYWEALRINFYLSGSQYHDTSSFATNQLGGVAHSFGSMLTGEKGQKRHKFNSSGSILSVSQRLFGEEIVRNSFKITDNSHTSGTVVIQDDGIGNLYAVSASISSSATALSSSDNYVGNIFYDLGVVTITDTGSFSHTPSTASIRFSANAVSHSQELHISASDLSTTYRFVVMSGSLTGSDDTNRFYITSASGHSEVSESAYTTMASMSKRINEVLNLDSPSGSFISASIEDSESFSSHPIINFTNDRKPNRPMHTVDNLPPITSSATPLIGFRETQGFGGGTAPINYGNVLFGNEGGPGSGSCTVKFDSAKTIAVKKFVANVGAGEFNYTNNHTSRKLSNINSEALSAQTESFSAYLKDDLLSGSISGSWGPCMTTIGFYTTYPEREPYISLGLSGKRDPHPVFIAKYPKAIMIPPDIPLIFEIHMDF